MTARSKARKRALDILFESDVRGSDPVENLQEWVRRSDPPVQDYAQQIVEGVAANREQIDGLITACLRDWSFERMPPVDRTILRLSTYELVCRDDVPAAVVIDEAVELAKSLSTDDSPAFVNGVLAHVLELKQADGSSAAPPR